MPVFVLFILPLGLVVLSWLAPLCVFFGSIGWKAKSDRWRADGTCAGCGYPRAGLPGGLASDSDARKIEEPVCPECECTPRPSVERRRGMMLGLACNAVIGAIALAASAAPGLLRAGYLQGDGFPLLLLPSLAMLIGLVAVFVARHFSRALPIGPRLWILGVAAVLQIVNAQTWMAFHGAHLASMG